MAGYDGQHERFKKLFYCKDDFEDDDCLDSSHLLNKESIIGLKICDSCIRKEYLDEKKIKPVKITPPVKAVEVKISGLKIKKIHIKKKPNPYRKGFWDIYIRYVFEYILTYYDKDDHAVDVIQSNNMYNQKITMSGCQCPNYIIGTDFLGHHGHTFKSGPFVLVKASAILLNPSVRLHGETHDRIDVLIGLFVQISLFKYTHLFIDSEGVCAT